MTTDLLWLLVRPSDWIMYTAVLGVVLWRSSLRRGGRSSYKTHVRYETPSMTRMLLRMIVAAALVSVVAPSAHAQLSAAKLESWLSGYREAWEKRDAERAAQLFTENARYQEMPFDAPKSGRAGIREYWSGVTADQRDVEFHSADDRGVTETPASRTGRRNSSRRPRV